MSFIKGTTTRLKTLRTRRKAFSTKSA